jgi:hypothetical protein
MEFYSVTKKNEILSFAVKWMELENILSGVSQAQNASYVDYRPKTNAEILLDMDPTPRKAHAQEK